MRTQWKHGRLEGQCCVVFHRLILIICCERSVRDYGSNRVTSAGTLMKLYDAFKDALLTLLAGAWTLHLRKYDVNNYGTTARYVAQLILITRVGDCRSVVWRLCVTDRGRLRFP
jgi:hypothetical protein